MGNIPVVHEVCTSFGSLGDAVVGKPENARQRWRDYAEESFFGSGIYAAHEARLGNKERARELGKGMGRATGKILCGGGLLKEIPVLHELATCGASLGDMIGGGDQHSARDRWEEYKEESVLGSGIQAAIEHKHGNQERSRELRRAMGRASTKAGITAGCTAGAIAVTIATAGAGTGVAIAASASAGSACGAAATAGVQAVDGKINSADVIGSMLLGGAAGAVGGAAAKGKLAGSTASKGIRAVAARSLAPQAMLTQVRARMQQQKQNRTKCMCPTAGSETNSSSGEGTDLNLTSWDLVEGRTGVECTICLDEELWENQFVFAHTCDQACNDKAHCCRHEFHAECLAEWRLACESQGVPFTCPECRAMLD